MGTHIMLDNFNYYKTAYDKNDYLKVLHLSALDSNTTATAQIISAFNKLQTAIRQDIFYYPMNEEALLDLFTNIIRPAYAILIDRFVKPVTFANQVITLKLFTELNKLKAKHPAIIFSNVNNIHNDYKQYMKILSLPYCNMQQQCDALKNMITEKYNAALKYFMLEPTTANNLNRLLSGARKHILTQDNSYTSSSKKTDQLSPEDEQLLAELESEYATTLYPAYITAPPNLINFIIV